MRGLLFWHRALRSGFPKNVSFFEKTSDQAPPLPFQGTSHKYAKLLGVFITLGLVGFLHPAHAVTLTYQNENKWVSTEDNAPLLALMKAAKGGQSQFMVGIPADNRPLSIQRLLIVRDILAREAGKPVLIEESAPAPKANTLIIQ